MVCRCVFWVLYNSATCVFSVVMSSGGDLEDGDAGIVSWEPSARRVDGEDKSGGGEDE